jgi:hypothetical protein
LNFVEGALQNIIFSRDAKAHMVVEQIRVGKGAARYPATPARLISISLNCMASPNPFGMRAHR